MNRLLILTTCMLVVSSYTPDWDAIQRVPLAAKLSALQTEYIRNGYEFPDRVPENVNMYGIMQTLREEALAVHIEDGIPEEYADDITVECKRDFDRYVDILTNSISTNESALWAGRMFDSTGFYEQGLYDGNFVFEGRYDECRRATETSEDGRDNIQGMHCLAYWYQIADVWPVKRGQGICIPHTCTDDDAITLLLAVYTPFLGRNTTGIHVHCERGKPDLSEDPAAIISIVILSLFGLLVVIATIYHYFMVEIKPEEAPSSTSGVETRPNGNEENMETYLSPQPRENPEYNQVHTISGGEGNNGYISEKGTEVEMTLPDNNGLSSPNGRSRAEPIIEIQHKKPLNSLSITEQLLMAFSMYVTMPLITTTKQTKSAIGCLNGIRFLAMAWIILGHTYIIGTLEMPPTLENELMAFSKWSILSYTKIETIDVYVDTFFILSAFLVSMSFLRKLEKTDGKLGAVGWIMYYFSRYWRLTPTYFIVLMIYTNFMHYFGTGPFMKDYISDVDGCATAWWTNLLYINNMYFGNGYCFGWSWYLCVDWQLYCVAPLFLYFLWRNKWIGIILNVAGFLVGIVTTAVLKHKLYTQGDDVEDPVDDFQDIYIKPWCRCSVYFMGIGLGYVFFKADGKIKMPKIVVCSGWLVALAMYLIVSYLPHTQPWTDAGAVAYYTLNRILWGIWVCWLILACANGYGGFVNTFLSWSFFVPLSKLTYLGYLIHPILCTLYFYGSPLQQYYYDYFFVYLFMANLGLVHVFSLVLVTAVSAPLMGTIAVFLPSMRGKTRR